MAKPRSAAGVLRAAKKLLTDVGWTRGDLKVYGGATGDEVVGYCALGAIREVDTKFQIDAELALCEAINKYYGQTITPFYRKELEKDWDVRERTIWEFNDRWPGDEIDQRKQDVLDAFDSAIKIASKRY